MMLRITIKTKIKIFKSPKKEAGGTTKNNNKNKDRKH